MKKSILIVSVLLGTSVSIFAGQSKLYPIIGPTNINCCGMAQYSIDVENINPTFAIENIDGTFVVTRQSQVIYQETIIPRKSDLEPGEVQTFTTIIPMELLLLDGWIEIFFEFGSDFDLNPNPTTSLNAFVTGCGLINAAAQAVFLAALGAEAEERGAYLFMFQQLLKPGTIIKGSGRDIYTKELAAFTWMAMLFNPLLRFEQPVTVALLDANTEEIEIIDANWPPIIFDEIYQPPLNSLDRIAGELDPVCPPPVPFTFESAPTIPVDSVCAILVSGIDFDELLKASFQRDMGMMKDALTAHKNGPRLPMSSVLMRKVTDGYNRDSLLQDLQNLKNKYNKIYFYYSGHGTGLGEMCLGSFMEDYLDYTTFTNALFESGAKQYCIMIDACYSGNAVEAICNHPEAANVDVEVITSSNNVKTSAATVWTIDTMNQWFGKFTSQFFWSMQDNATDKNMDGRVSFFEGFTKVNSDNFAMITDEQCPVGKNIKNHTITTIGQNMLQYALPIYGIGRLEHSTLWINPEVLPAGTTIQPYDQSQTFTLPQDSYFSWIEWNSNAAFGKETTYSFIEPLSYQTTFQDNIQFWPIISSFPGYNAFDPTSVYSPGKYIIDGLPPVSITEPIQTPPDTSDKKIAFVVTGFHPETSFQQAFQVSGTLFYDNLASEQLGDQFPETDIKVIHNPTGPQLLNILGTYPDDYDKVFFYYAGNSTNTGLMCLGDDPANWLSYSDLFQGLGSINGKGYKLFFDCSYSGKAVEFIQQTEIFNGKRLDLFTSTDNETPTYLEFYEDAGTQLKFGANFMTLRLMENYGDPLVEYDGEEGTSHKEAFNRLFILNPVSGKGVRLFDLSKPKSYVSRYLSHGANEPLDRQLRSLDLSVNVDHRHLSSIDVHGIQDFEVIDQVSADPNVYAVSPVRRWKLTGTWDIDPAFKADLIFHYQEDLDLLSSTEGLHGLVSRTSPDEDWTAWYPSMYDLQTKQITAVNVTDAREWAIAKIEEIVGTEDVVVGLSEVSLFPNPAMEYLHISFVLQNGKNISIRILDLNGKVVYERKSESFSAGRQFIQLDLPTMAAGLYYVELADQQGKTYRPFVVNK